MSTLIEFNATAGACDQDQRWTCGLGESSIRNRMKILLFSLACFCVLPTPAPEADGYATDRAAVQESLAGAKVSVKLDLPYANSGDARQ